MSQTNMLNLCHRYYGRNVRITCHDGKIHTGQITKVDRDMVWIRPASDLGGYGFGYWGYRRRRSFGIGIAIGAIAGIVLASAFFW